MTGVTHVAVGLGISAFFPEEYRVAAVALSVLPDADHLLYLRSLRPRIGGMQHARTILHELLGTVLWIAAGLAVATFDRTLGALFLVCVLAHLFLDYVSGASHPYRAIRETPRVDMGRAVAIRVFQEIAVAGGALWLFWTS